MDMVVLAHIKEQSRLSQGSYVRPRMTEELKEVGIDVGHRLPGSGLHANRERGRVGRLMRENGIVVERTRKFKVMQYQNLIQWIKFPAARQTAITRSTSRRTCWTATSRQNGPMSNGRAISATSGPVRVGCISPSPLICIPGASSPGPRANRVKRDLAIRALKMAIALRSPPRGCIFHSDRGSQYCSHYYQKVLREHGFKVSPLANVNIRCRAVDERQGQLLR